MAVQTIHGQVILPAVNGMSSDAAINTFTFSLEYANPVSYAQDISTTLEGFYNDSPGVDPLASYLARNRTRETDACEMRWFDISGHLNGTPAGPPIYIHNWTLGPYSTSEALPEEVALALSFHGSFGSLSEFGGGIRPKARHRGRMFLGPLAGNTLSTLTPDWMSHPTADLQGDLLAAGQALMDLAVGWSVWSRRNAAVYPVVGGWVDNAWDTIRGRGGESTFRSSFGSIV